MFEAATAEKNARLLIVLKERFGARDIGCVSGFFDTHEEWHCPCCCRSKLDIARLDKNENLLCSFVWHHDHFEDAVQKKLRERAELTYADVGASSDLNSLRVSFVRFQSILICGDCNVVEPVAKAVVNAPPEFSFAPYEIAAFIEVAPNSPHKVNEVLVGETYDVARQAMISLQNRLRDVVNYRGDGNQERLPVGTREWLAFRDTKPR